MPLPTETRTIDEISAEIYELGFGKGSGTLPVDYVLKRFDEIKSELSLSQNRILEELLSMQKVAINEQEEVRNPYTTKAFVLGEDGKFKLPPPAREIRNLKYVSVEDIIKLISKKDN